MSNDYSGPYCNVTLATGQTYSVQGSRGVVTQKLLNHESGLAALQSVYGDAITVGVAHVASVEQMPGEWSVED